jgi:FAD/FMN-containing dehydrogenase
MSFMQHEIKKQLIDLFGDRVAFHRIERLLYASDLASLPKMVTDRIKTMPDAVAQPLHSEELSALVQLAALHKIPLVPGARPARATEAPYRPGAALSSTSAE